MTKSTAVSKMPAGAVAIAASMKAAASAIQSSAGDMPFLRLLKSGEWVFGADDTDVEKGSLWAVDPNSFCIGFQAWGTDADLLGEITALVTEQPVLRSDLEDVGGEWKPLMGATLVCISGEDEGLMVSFKTTSKGGLKAMGALMTAIVSRVNSAPKDGTYIPVVELDTDNYKHKTYGRIYTPVLAVKDWTDEAELMGDAPEVEEEAEPEVEEVVEAPKKRTRKAKAKVEETPEPEPEPEVEGELVEEEAPAPRRRRRRA